jgi:Fe2+ or Zn2+ uptake regulation protein
VQRRVILDTVLDLDNHPSADQIFEAVEPRLPGIARTTVYRALEHVADVGVITIACHPGRVTRLDPRLELRHHLVCLRCDEFIDFEDASPDSLKIPDTSAFGFEVNDYRVQLRKICKSFRKKEMKEESRRGKQHLSCSSAQAFRPRRESSATPARKRRGRWACRRGQKIYRGWNFWTDDAEEVQALLHPFDDVTVIYGHVHQIQYNQIGNISFHAVMATAWPWPYPRSYAQAESYMPKITVPMNRADPFFERDATGWQFIDMKTGRIAMEYNLYNNTNRTVAYNPKTGRPEDTKYQAPDDRITPQMDY